MLTKTRYINGGNIMRVTGIIAEYNPFHNGHLYQLTQAGKETDADYIIVAMSGNFLQRGVPAILDKHTRAHMALLAGADLVVELPALHATASAEYFAQAGVSLLAAATADTICYGCENVNKELMQALTDCLLHAPASYDRALTGFLKEGDSYPAARSRALCQLLPEWDSEEIAKFLASPNNILALEYEKAIASCQTSLTGHPILRKGEGYHSTNTDSVYASATAIRKLLLSGSDCFPELEKSLPKTSLTLLREKAKEGLLLDADDFSDALYTRLLSLPDGYTDFAGCSRGLSDKITNRLNRFTGFQQFAELLKSRDLTYTGICRALLHILLGITKEGCTRFSQSNPQYLRVLGFRKSASPLLQAIKKEASVPLVTKVSDASDYLSADAYALLKRDIHAADLYRGIAAVHCGKLLPNEYNRQIPIIP